MPAPSPKNKTAPFAGNSRRTKKASWRSLNWQLMFITILPLTALVLLVAIGSLSVHQNAMRNLVGERDLLAVRTAATAIQEQITHRLYTIESLATLAEEVNPEQFEGILLKPGYLTTEFDAGLAIFSLQGQLVANSLDSPLWMEFSTRLPELLQKQADHNQVALAFIQVEKPLEDGHQVISFYSFSPSQQWIVAGAASIARIVDKPLGQAFSSEYSTSIILVDAEQRLLYQQGTPSYQVDSNLYPGVQEALGGKSGVNYTLDQKNELVMAYSPVGSQGWALVFQEVWQSVELPTLRISQLAPLVLALCLILAIVALGFGAKQIITPLQKLEAKASLLAWGNFDAIETPVGGIDEIRQLQDELIHMADKVRSAQKNLHSYIGAITSAQEDERLRLACELHDETIQALIALNERAQLYQLSASRTEGEASALSEIASLTEETIQNLRRLIHALRPIYLEDLGLTTALEMLTRETAQALGIPVGFRKQGAEKRLQAQIELALFRMAQEAFRNIERHAQATQADLRILFEQEILTLEVSDDGIGFEVPKNPSEFAPSGHYGLLGLYERADLIGATLEIQSELGKGTFLKIPDPLFSQLIQSQPFLQEFHPSPMASFIRARVFCAMGRRWAAPSVNKWST